MVDYWSNFHCQQGVPLFSALVLGRTHQLMTAKFSLKKIQTLLYNTVCKVFRYLEPLGMDHECDRQTDKCKERRTDGWTDILIANAVLNNTAWPKTAVNVVRFLEV